MPQNVNFQTVQSQAPDLASALTRLEGALNAFNAIREEVLPQQEKGLDIPGVAEKIRNAEKRIAAALDGVSPLIQKYSDNEAVTAVAMSAYQEGTIYLQGILFGVNYSRVNAKHPEGPFKRLLAEAYHLLDRQVK